MTTKINPFVRKAQRVSPAQVEAARQNARVTDPNTGDFNPRKADSTERVYNDRGEVNAGSKREAAQIAVHAVRELGNAAVGRVAQETQIRSAAARREAVWSRVAAEVRKDASRGIALVAQTIKQSEPIKLIGDYQSIHEIFIKTMTLQDGQFHRLPYDISVGAYFVAPGGGGFARVIGGQEQQYLIAPEFGVQANFEMSAYDMHTATWDMYGRAEVTAKQNVAREKDKRFVAVLDALSTQVNPLVEFTQLSRAHFAQASLRLQRWGFAGKRVLIHVNELLTDLVGGNFVSDLDPASAREVHTTGYVGRYGGWEFVTAHGANGLLNIMPEGTMYFCADKEFIGEAATRVELDALPYELPVLGRAGSGMLLYSQMTMGLIGSRAVVKGQRVSA